MNAPWGDAESLTRRIVDEWVGSSTDYGDLEWSGALEQAGMVSPKKRKEIAAAHIMRGAYDVIRENVRRLEEAQPTPPPPSPRPDPWAHKMGLEVDCLECGAAPEESCQDDGRLYKGLHIYRRIGINNEHHKHGFSSAINQGCGCPTCVKVAQEDREREERLADKLNEALQDYKAVLRMSWERELLESTFALGDGSYVKWGEATVDQHLMRQELLMKNAQGNMETASRHAHAVDKIREAGAKNLNEVMGR